jgi:protein-L-isoaspartate(D-aspartate) O-methyltransferase
MLEDYKTASKKMVDSQLVPRNIKSEAVLEAMYNVPRHLFVPDNMQKNAFNDSALPIGLGQTISQPYIVAFMTEHLGLVPGMKILEIGTGSGYQAAILSYLGCKVYTIELLEELAKRAKETLDSLNFSNIYIKHGDGYLGWQEESPFDAIIVTAAPDYIPEKLFEQLKEGGNMIIPVGEAFSVQVLKHIIKKDGAIIENDLFQVRFVPMVESNIKP